jgi:cytochrome P450
VHGGEPMREQTVLDLASFEPDVTRDPYPLYAELRDSMPVRQVRLHGLRGWMVTGYQAVRRALSDPSLSNDRANASADARTAQWLFADEAFNLQHHMLRSDPPAHTRIRRLTAPAFTARKVGQLRPRIHHIAHELVDAFADAGSAELVSAYAFPLPLRIIIEILGVPSEDHAQLLRWSNVLSSGRAAKEAEIVDTLTKMRDYFRALTACKSRQPVGEPGLLDTLVFACYRDGELSESELLSSAFQLLQGGHVTTLGLIANATLAILQEPERLAELRADEELVDAAVDELLRFDPPMEVATIRFTTKETRICDVTIPGGGEPVILALAAANRDPAMFTEPDAIDFGRDCSGHLGFGHGGHYCLGAHLARAETRIAIRVLLSRLDDLALAVDPARLDWRPNPHLRRPERLPVTFSAR